METITLGQAKLLIKAMAHKESLLLLSPPGVGKSDVIRQAAEEEGLPLRSLLGTQIAPEDVSGIPQIVNGRSVFCPPRILLPEEPEPFCLFLDELPAAAPDVQKALYALLLERRLGEHQLPKGTWVVAAGNRQQDRALVRQISSALINRTFVVQIRVDLKEWMIWAQQHGIRKEIISFINFFPDALIRDVSAEPVPFSTPRAWASLSQALDLVERAGALNPDLVRALCFGRVSAADAAIFCTTLDVNSAMLLTIEEYVRDPQKLPDEVTQLWFLLNRIKHHLLTGKVEVSADELNRFLLALPQEQRFALFAGHVWEWGRLGVSEAFLETLKQVTGLV
ncbi:AAA domain-containing protein [Spirosoma sp. HMF4905]|uniref:AAA domain-containing protein n=1 Tax=Spirosoma arboris TaxID=2682092 RepID=A0A7K1SBS0_9BACT|nr:MoxR family ATPase [Spirosoma arboris]MVM31262.1 AAA domain-containing protein [Spirosoma arboris]